MLPRHLNLPRGRRVFRKSLNADGLGVTDRLKKAGDVRAVAHAEGEDCDERLSTKRCPLA